MMDLRRRLLVGALGGVLTAGVFAVWAVLVWDNNTPDWLNRRMTLPALVALYLMWGVVAGTCLGGAFPWARTSPGAVVVGAAVLVGLYIPAGFLLNNSLGSLVFLGIVGALVGGLAGRRVLGPGSPYLPPPER
jgi:hypothetical protein